MTIKVLEKTPGCFPYDFEVGDWYDLVLAEDAILKVPTAHKMHIRKGESGELRTRDVVFDYQELKLGLAMEIPKGFEAHILPRSSTFRKWGILLVNSTGIVDNSYKGDNDEWRFPVLATKNITIPKGTRVAQFRILPSQKATVWQKLKWLLSGKPKLKLVGRLGNKDRKGLGEGTNKESINQTNHEQK